MKDYYTCGKHALYEVFHIAKNNTISLWGIASLGSNRTDSYTLAYWNWEPLFSSLVVAEDGTILLSVRIKRHERKQEDDYKPQGSLSDA